MADSWQEYECEHPEGYQYSQFAKVIWALREGVITCRSPSVTPFLRP